MYLFVLDTCEIRRWSLRHEKTFRQRVQKLSSWGPLSTCSGCQASFSSEEDQNKELAILEAEWPNPCTSTEKFDAGFMTCDSEAKDLDHELKANPPTPENVGGNKW